MEGPGVVIALGLRTTPEEVSSRPRSVLAIEVADNSFKLEAGILELTILAMLGTVVLSCGDIVGDGTIDGAKAADDVGVTST